jgi:hypothetical protein
VHDDGVPKDGVPLRDVRPELLARVTVLLDRLGERELAVGLAGQAYYGECRCGPRCDAVLTAPRGSSSSLMIWLEDAGGVVGEVSLNADGTMVTAVELAAEA